VSQFERSIELAPNNALSVYHLGLAHVQQGDLVRARELLERAISLDPRFDGADDARRALASIRG
jgi:tetratricopeptide (TPR) repeat protein